MIDVVHFLQSEFPKLNIYPLEYPLDSPDNSCVVEMQPNTPATAGLFNVNVQIKVRDIHPSKAEATSFEFINKLEDKTNFYINGVQIVFVKAQNPLPLPMGKDVNGKYLYSNNFRFVMNKGG
jgi:Bacteriophage minor capsid protein